MSGSSADPTSLQAPDGTCALALATALGAREATAQQHRIRCIAEHVEFI